MEKRIYLSPPHMGGEEMKYVQEAFDSNWIAPLGPMVDAFEHEVAEYVGAKGALALSSGTAAIHLSLKALGVKDGDHVFCSTLTFAGSSFPILYERAIPVFIDSEPETWNMSSDALERAFHWAKKEGKLPKAVIAVNLYGQSADWDRILPICDHYGVPVIEDAAESLGATYQGKQTGTFGRIGVFSFNGNKIITTSGGGMVVSDNEEALQKMKFWATQAREPARHYEHKEVGYNYRMSNIVAAIGRGQMKVLAERIQRKKEIFYAYKETFAHTPEISFMPTAPYGEPNYWMTVITVEKNSKVRPDEIITKLEELNIESRPVGKPMHLQPVFADCDYFKNEADISADIFANGICLPSGTAMSEEQQEFIISNIQGLFVVMA